LSNRTVADAYRACDEQYEKLGEKAKAADLARAKELEGEE